MQGGKAEVMEQVQQHFKDNLNNWGREHIQAIGTQRGQYIYEALSNLDPDILATIKESRTSIVYKI